MSEKREWRCFHCDQVFTSEHCARLHFGADETHYPACQIKGSEGGLLRALREAEAQLMQAQQDAHDEAGPVLDGWRDAQHRHHRALIAMEETGYERGMADMRAEMADGDLVKALRAARQFISNGIELGYIKMPDPTTPDSAHDTLPMIETALAWASSEKAKRP